MPRRYDPDHHHRHSIRLRNHAYTATGIYFVTICTFGREPLFGTIVDGAVIQSGYGAIVAQEWQRIADVRPSVRLDAFMIMPDHIHGLLMLEHSTPNNTSATLPAPRRFGQSIVGSLQAILGQFKSVVTKRVNSLRQTPGAPVWQRNYYERIIRDEEALQRVRRYIQNNPTRWDQ